MTFELPDLPYSRDALEPHISKETIDYHYGKHHATYVNNLNKLVEGNTTYANKTLEEIIKTSTGPIFNNAAQVWNHSFYWSCLDPQGGGDLSSGQLKEAIEQAFGSFQSFKNEFTNSAVTNFGSGWTWLVKNQNNGLKIVNTSNAGCPLNMEDELTPILTCDVWEHAYYIDHRNARPKYVETFWKLVNWNFVKNRFES